MVLVSAQWPQKATQVIEVKVPTSFLRKVELASSINESGEKGIEADTSMPFLNFEKLSSMGSCETPVFSTRIEVSSILESR